MDWGRYPPIITPFPDTTNDFRSTQTNKPLHTARRSSIEPCIKVFIHEVKKGLPKIIAGCSSKHYQQSFCD